MTLSYSPLAKKVQGVRPIADARIRDPWGLLIHTTGRGVPEHAKKNKTRPIDVAIKTYINSQNGSNGYFWGGPTYICDHDGSFYQLSPEEVQTNHCGAPGVRTKYLSGSWISLCHPSAIAAWHSQWGPKYRSPYHLFPATSPNVNYVGVEMIPCGAGFGEPMAGLLFTQAQHDAIVDLARDIGQRHQWPNGWHRGPRLVGHEDVDILNRMDKNGGWDPGFLREKPYFNFTYVRNRIA